ncbi:MAG TPA: energy-coupling factor transporter transmembrane protein EcfT [Clostridiales bacterium]|nr:energy-coupling factor transporter transmembrane protein EcfT [Clostridiales bacterium]
MRTLPTGQFIPGNSLLHKLDARIKIICFIILIAAVIGASSILGYSLVLVTISALILLSQLPISYALGSIRRMCLFFLVIFMMNALFNNSGGLLASWWIFQISTGGIKQGFTVVLNVILIIILASLLTLTTSPTQVTTALESLIKPLKIIGIPTEDIAMIISIAIQFIPTLMEETETIKMAQIARGARFESKKLSDRARSYIPLIIPIFISAFRRADELSLAMEARGYRNAKNRTKKKREEIELQDYIALTICVTICIVQFKLLR